MKMPAEANILSHTSRKATLQAASWVTCGRAAQSHHSTASLPVVSHEIMKHCKNSHPTFKNTIINCHSLDWSAGIEVIIGNIACAQHLLMATGSFTVALHIITKAACHTDAAAVNE